LCRNRNTFNAKVLPLGSKVQGSGLERLTEEDVRCQMFGIGCETYITQSPQRSQRKNLLVKKTLRTILTT